MMMPKLCKGDYYNEQMELRPCQRCGFVRRVVVTTSTGGTPRWQRLCTICQLEDRAAKHEQQARVFRARIRDLIDARMAQQLKASARATRHVCPVCGGHRPDRQVSGAHMAPDGNTVCFGKTETP